jgi:MFS family permease
MKLPPLIALQGVFAAHAASLGLWFPRIPEIKATLELDFTMLSLAILGLPIGTILGMGFAPRIAQALGLTKACIFGGAMFALLMVLPALAINLGTLWLSLFVSGLSLSIIEVAMNAKANEYQDTSGRRIMSRCHAFWSLGVMGGALIAGYMSDLGMSFLTQQLIFETLSAIIVIAFALTLPKDVESDRDAPKSKFRLPKGALLALCIMPLGALMIEGAMLDWSVLFSETELGTTTFIGSLILSTFSISMAAGRYAGDWLTGLMGERMMLIVSGVTLAVGLAIFASSTTVTIAALGALLTGFGSANPYPIAMSLARYASERRTEENIAAIAIISFCAFLIAPPVIGFMAQALTLPTALLLLSPVGLISTVLIMMNLINTQGRP